MVKVDAKTLIDTLRDAWGPQRWWPAETPFEVLIGAILTQNTAWTNVERAIANLRSQDLLDARRLRETPLPRLEELIRPAGYFRQKAARLHIFLDWYLDRFDGKIENMRAEPLESLREELLALNGIGPETADAMLCYAARKAVFVVDAYTVRLFARHNLCAENSRYQEVQAVADEALPDDWQYRNEAHALIVEAGKRHCFKRNPDCAGCPLGKFLDT